MLNLGPGFCSIAMAVDKNFDAVATKQFFPIKGMQSFSLASDDTVKGFQGEGKMHIHKATVERKISGSVEGPIPPALMSQIVSGEQAITQGNIFVKSPDLALVAVASTGGLAKVTYAIPTGGTYVENCGLSLMTATGGIVPMIAVADAPTGYQYTVEVTGQNVVYEFDDALLGKSFLADVIYSKAGDGVSFDIHGGAQGESPVFQLLYRSKFRDMDQMVRLYWVTFTKYDLAGGKNGDFSTSKLEFECFEPVGAKAGECTQTLRSV